MNIEEKTDKMRSLVIFNKNGKSVFELLKNTDIKNWALTDSGYADIGGHPYCLRKGDEKVLLRLDSELISKANSSNVMPYDSNNDPEGANKLIKELSDALTEAGIENSIIASNNDLKN